MLIRQGHVDPFQGMCIHGRGGARFIEGELRSRSCPNCFPEEAHPCPYAEEILNDHTSLCTCDPERTQQCAWEI